MVATAGTCFLADKWLGQPPSPGGEKWTTRETKIAGFADYLVALQAWAAFARRDWHSYEVARGDLAAGSE